MKIDSFRFGSISIDGRKYKCDVLIHADGSVEKRKGGLLMFGSHHIGKENFERLCEVAGKPDLIVVGLGTDSVARIEKDAEDFARVSGIQIEALPSADAVSRLNMLFEEGKMKVAGLIHVTC